jgi:hypothetical protein
LNDGRAHTGKQAAHPDTYTNTRQRIVMLVDGEKEPMQVDEWADLKL